MIQHFSFITCDKCLTQIKVSVDREDFAHCVGSDPLKIRNYIIGNKWKELIHGKHVCPGCKHSFNKMISECDAIKREYWGGEIDER